jgi:TonB family protein
VKRLLILFVVTLLVSFGGNVYSQTLTPPEFPGGKQALRFFLHENLKWPETADHELKGVVITGFFVEKDGRLTNLAIKQSLAPDFDKEALRLMALSPPWIPAMQDKKIIKSTFNVPILFFGRDIYVPGDAPLIRPTKEELVVALPRRDQPVSSNSTAADPPDKIYTSVEKVPQFPGGAAKFLDYVQENLKNEKITSTDQGIVIVTFVAEPDGSLTDIKISRSVSDKCDSLALKLLKNSPKWSPGTRNGRPVRVLYSVPVRFKPNT